MRMLSVAAALAVALLVTSLVQPVPALAQDRTIEEIIVTARQREESLQDVPVTVAAFSEADIDRYNINTLTQLAKMVPNMQINQGGSGNGSSLYLRGVGSSSISAAFDQSVALNIDGVVINRGRMIHHAYLDMKRIEILKGPQSLYFGKSATAGVISVLSNNPGPDLEVEGMIAYESEYDQTYSEFLVSGPLTDTFGARLVVGTTDSDELFENLSPDVANHWRGEESQDARLTLLWEPADFFSANFKLSYQDYKNDGANGRTEQICAEPVVQNTTTLGLILPNASDDCKLNGNTGIGDINAAQSGQIPTKKGGVPYLEQTTYLPSLTLNFDINDQLTVTSVTAYTDLQHEELDNYSYADSGVFGGFHKNSYEAWSQEFRLASDYDGSLNFMGGLYYQTIDQSFKAFQYAANIGLIAPDPITGNTFDYQKNHFLDTDVWSAFGAVYWDVTDTIEVTAGMRYTDEQKDGYITIPYVHLFLQGVFSAPPVIPDLQFDDDNWSPEVAVNWHVTPEISVFAAYKEGFKSGGIDNSALPTATLDPGSNPDFPDFLIYESEDAKGGETGVKANLLDGSMRLNGTAFYYIYSDLQVQLFDAVAIQFATFNASELTVYGLEADSVWFAPFMEGLQLRGAIAYTHAEYTDDFFNAQGQNLDGEDRERNAEWAGFAGLSYNRELGSNFAFELSVDARYSDEYRLAAELQPDIQDSFWLYDAALRVYTQDERYELSLIGRNLGDEIYAYGNGPRPGACAGQVGNVCTGGRQDQTTSTSLGQTYTLQLRVRL